MSVHVQGPTKLFMGFSELTSEVVCKGSGRFKNAHDNFKVRRLCFKPRTNRFQENHTSIAIAQAVSCQDPVQNSIRNEVLRVQLSC